MKTVVHVNKTQPLTADELSAYHVGLFATHPTLVGALDYAYKIAKASDNPPAVMTAVHVVLNTAIAALHAQSAPAQAEA